MSLLRQFLVSCALLSSASLLHQAAALPSLPLPPGYELGLRSIAKQDVQRRARESFVTQFISVQQQLVTVTDRVTVTSTQFQTCTAVAPGTPPCPTLQSAVTASPSITAAPEAVQAATQSNVTTSPSVPVLLPSCNCHEDDLPKLLDDGYRLFSRRTPRFLNPQAPQPVIVLTLTTTLVDTVLSTVQDMATTVGITYGGCIPTDAITTTACSGA